MDIFIRNALKILVRYMQTYIRNSHINIKYIFNNFEQARPLFIITGFFFFI